jgi:hypothetical protein
VPVTTEAAGDHYRDTRRRSNERKVASLGASKTNDRVELDCECVNEECGRAVRIPVYVYRRMVEAGDQYLLQPGHHAFPRYRTIVTTADASIEERRA